MPAHLELNLLVCLFVSHYPKSDLYLDKQTSFTFQNNGHALKATLNLVASCKRHSLGAVVEQEDETVRPRGVNVEEEGEVNHHSQGEQQHLHTQGRLDEHNHSQHGQQAAVQVVLDV